jgi:Zn-dependent M16 (insulinase) family peptidase
MSLATDDENKCFGVVLRTPPADSTGIPHILEHSVLCGSRKYPIKEPFVELMKGSLNTFLNAFTYPDRTCYPVASTNLQARADARVREARERIASATARALIRLACAVD